VQAHDIETMWICGGAGVYAEAMTLRECTALFVTRIHARFAGCDVSFPPIDPARYRLSHTSPARTDAASGTVYHVDVYVRCDAIPQPPAALPWGDAVAEHEEFQYLRLIADVLATGAEKPSRAGPTLSKFGAMLKFSLRAGAFPLLTTKRVFWRGVAEELLWFVRGDTSALSLQAKGVHIWDANATPEFLAKACPSCRYEPGDLGPVYGFQWRHFGAEYCGSQGDHAGKGVDQLRGIIDTIRRDPESRRNIMSAWNPVDLAKMALPPCHVLSHFMVVDHGCGLACLLYQRSADLGLGVPFNIASYALLTAILAHVTGLYPAELVHVIGDAHVYTNHIGPLREQLTRAPRPFPRLTIKRQIADIEDFRFEDFDLIGYDPWPTIKMEMNP
jgi:dihydrofolate reductase/thymidylate synthase